MIPPASVEELSEWIQSNCSDKTFVEARKPNIIKEAIKIVERSKPRLLLSLSSRKKQAPSASSPGPNGNASKRRKITVSNSSTDASLTKSSSSSSNTADTSSSNKAKNTKKKEREQQKAKEAEDSLTFWTSLSTEVATIQIFVDALNVDQGHFKLGLLEEVSTFFEKISGKFQVIHIIRTQSSSTCTDTLKALESSSINFRMKQRMMILSCWIC
jgi:hypothetical protein